MPGQNVTASATFRKSFESNDITIDAISDQTYTGSPITPIVTVKDGNEPLTEGDDYTVSYSNNINAGSNAAVTIIGQGSYSGEKTVKFTITPKSITGASPNHSGQLQRHGGAGEVEKQQHHRHRPE